MKKLKLIVLGSLALVFGRPGGYCTANTLTDDVAAVNQRLSDLEAQNTALKADHAAQLADLQERLNAALASKPAQIEDTGLMATLARGAGVDLADVRWRVAAGVAVEQAVQAALSQKQFNESEAAKKAAAK
jgi:hypothetical protein